MNIEKIIEFEKEQIKKAENGSVKSAENLQNVNVAALSKNDLLKKMEVHYR